MKTKFFKLFFIFLVSFQNYLFSQNINIKIQEKFLPEIQNLSYKDVQFIQVQDAISVNKSNFSNGREIYLEFFKYAPKKNENLFTISAFFNIPYDTIATLNSLENIDQNLQGQILIIPTAEGLFITKNQKNPIETIIFADNQNFVEKSNKICYIYNNRIFYFISGKRFTPSTRLFFLDSGMKMPLEKMKVTSEFGLRKNPFSNELVFHNGTDLACKEGTKVFSCKSGTVDFIKFNDEIFGNYIILRHNNNITSVYAHLSKILVKQGESIRSGQEIALSGKTGRVTGPHLHFEVKVDGKAVDPIKLK